MTRPQYAGDARYDATALAAATALTRGYTTSFALGIRLFAPGVRPGIYSVYGLVRLADEIVDSWPHLDAAVALGALERETEQAVATGFSLNPIVHAYARAAIRYRFDASLIRAFFASMRMDLEPVDYTRSEYQRYIYGSAEVIGLMCLAVFTDGDEDEYHHLRLGARALGAAFQKVNFLRDLAADHEVRGRMYFPDLNYAAFDETAKRSIIAEIDADFERAQASIEALPTNCRRGVRLASRYYRELLRRLEQTPADTIKRGRIRVPDARKFGLLVRELALPARRQPRG